MPIEGTIGDQRATMMLEKVRRYMERHHMSQWREPLWVAVSGGVDSMVLLHVLHSLRHPVSVVHVDHALRGAESDADHQFVKEHCERHRLPFRSAQVDVKTRALEQGVSIQMAARELRYDLFRQLVNEGPEKLALAHHQDDALETLFIQIMHGMGLHGWRTIPPVSGPFIRPFMGISRQEILEYASLHDVPYREDRSNADLKYLRNKVRHELLPMLESWRPGVRRSLSRSVEILREMEHLMHDHLQEQLDEQQLRLPAQIPINRILDQGTPRSMLHHLLRRHGFHPDRLEDILLALQERKTGATFSDGGVQVIVDREMLHIEEVKDEPGIWTILAVDDPPKDLPLLIEEVKPQSVDITEGHSVAWLDLETLDLPLQLRPWKAGDRMRPIGMQGSKLISDILIDAKVPRNEKAHTYVLESNGTIIWLVGHRIAAGHEARESTRRVLRLAWQGGA